MRTLEFKARKSPALTLKEQKTNDLPMTAKYFTTVYTRMYVYKYIDNNGGYNKFVHYKAISAQRKTYKPSCFEIQVIYLFQMAFLIIHHNIFLFVI